MTKLHQSKGVTHNTNSVWRQCYWLLIGGNLIIVHAFFIPKILDNIRYNFKDIFIQSKHKRRVLTASSFMKLTFVSLLLLLLIKPKYQCKNLRTVRLWMVDIWVPWIINYRPINQLMNGMFLEPRTTYMTLSLKVRGGLIQPNLFPKG